MLQHHFKIYVPGMALKEDFSFTKIYKPFRNITISPEEHGIFLLTVKKRRTHPIDLSTQEAIEEANLFADKLCLIKDHDVTDLQYVGYLDEKNEFTPAKKKRSHKPINLIVSHGNLEEYYSSNKDLFEKTANLGLLRTYRIALGIEDIISKYLILYGILLVLNDEKQKNVDAYIEKQIPDIQIVDGNRGLETIITRIRNMIAHPKESFELNEASELAEKYINDLKELVIKKLRSS